MAAAAVSGGRAARRPRLLAALALLAALCPLPATRPAGAEEDRKVWQALTEKDRLNRAAPAAPAAAAPAAGPSSRDATVGYVVVGVVLAVCVVVTALAAVRRPRPAAAPPPPAEPAAAENEIELLWRSHLTRKRREQDPGV